MMSSVEGREVRGGRVVEKTDDGQMTKKIVARRM